MIARMDPRATEPACEGPLQGLIDTLPMGVLLARNGRLLAANPRAHRLLGQAPSTGTPLATLFEHVPPALLGTGPDGDATTHLRTPGGRLHACIRARDIALVDGPARLLVLEDLSESDHAQARLREQSEALQAMAHRLLNVQEDERRALSRELHDDIGQSITAIKLTALTVADEDDGARRAALVAELTAIADHTIHKLRDLSMLLRPPQLDALGLEAALRWQASALFRNGAPALRLDIHAPAQRPAPDVELACFRIAQEALTNILRHAQARHVQLHLDGRGEALHLRVDDDGIGIDPARPPGLGLLTMRERAQLAGGSLRIDSDPRGTRLHACLPLQQAASHAA